MSETVLRARYRFGPFQLDPAERLLLKDGVPVALTRKAFDTLLYLVGHGGRLVSRDELIRAVWPDAIVEEGNLHWVISTLRKALGSPGRGEEALIQTVHGVGYRFRGPVEVDGGEPEEAPKTGGTAVAVPPAAGASLAALPDPPVFDEGSPAAARRGWIAVAAVAALFLLLTGGIWGTGRLRGGPSKAEELRAAGLRAWRAGDPLGAQRLLKDSVASDLSFAPARAALARVLADLGDEGAAEREALAALRTAKDLPLRQRLDVEAAYHVSVRHWEEAIERHRRLWREHPRDAALGLALARVLQQGGRSRDALAAIAEVRRAFPGRRDPWLDLVEADVATDIGDFARGLRAATAAERAGGSAYLRAQAQIRQAAAWYGLQKPEPAEAAVVRAQQTAAGVPVPALQARILHIGGAVRLLAGDLDGAATRYEESYALSVRQGTRSALPRTLLHLARISLLRGDLGGAQARYERALAHCIEQRRADCQADSQTELGHIALSRGELQTAREHFEISRKIQNELMDPVLASRNLAGLIKISETLGDLEAAERWVREKLALDRRQGQAWNVFLDEIVAAHFCNEQGRPREALALLRAGEERPETASFAELRAHALEVRALALLRLGEREAADAASRQGMELLRRMDDNVYTEAFVLAGRARVLRGLGRLDEAREVAETLLARVRASRLENWEMEARLIAGDIALASGDRRLGTQILRDLAAEARLKSQIRIAREAETLLRGSGGA